MSVFRDQCAEHAASVFRNTDHFAAEFQFKRTGQAAIDLVGVLDEDDTKLSDKDEVTADVISAKLRCVDIDKADQMTDEAGWIPDGDRKFVIVGRTERDTLSNTVTLLLSDTNPKSLRAQYPH